MVMEKTTFAAVSGRHEQAKLLAAQRLRREMTPAERAFWYHLRGNRLDGRHFRRQQVIDGFIADFYCHDAALAVELDGPVHARQADYDAERDRIIRERGIRVLRFANAQVLSDRPSVLAQIRAAVQQSPPSSPSESSRCGRTPRSEERTKQGGGQSELGGGQSECLDIPPRTAV